MTITPSKFTHVYKQLVYITKSRYPDIEPSFDTGLWYEEEGYKCDLREQARASLGLDTWPAHRDDPDYITHKATQPFGIQAVDSGKLQNLVSYENYSKLFEIFLNYPKESAAALYEVFFDKDEQAAFTRLSKLLAKKSLPDPLSVASLYFFLKDKDRYVTARKQGTGERLSRLGLSAACVQKCTWAGYQEYLSIIHEIHGLLLPMHPEASLLDAQSFLWMLWMVNPDTPEYEIADDKVRETADDKGHETAPAQNNQPQRILFCNITWMESYDHILNPSDKPKHGGAYVSETGSAFESWNFHRYDDGKYYGFVETMYTGETAVQENAKQLHVERIERGAGEEAHDVTVVFCAHSDKTSGTVIVGWYEGATVYRYRSTCYDGHAYNITAYRATLLPEILRTKAVPRARKDGVGFGQSNVWYAEDAGDVIQDVLAYIGKFDKPGAVDAEVQRTIESMTDDELLQGYEEASGPAPTYTQTTTARKRNMLLPELVKRQAAGKCQLCGEDAPFVNKYGEPYLEAHHIVPLAADGPDEPSNMVALCPNCHRRMHVLNLPEDVEKLRKVARR